MQFFKHQANMRNDLKLKRGIKRYGLKYYGLYNLILESIVESLSSSSPLPELEDTAQDIAEQYNDDTAAINEMMAHMLNQGLFTLNEINGSILCHKIYRYLDKSQTRSAEIRTMIDNYKQSCIKRIECHGQSETCGDNSDIVEYSIVDDSRIEPDKTKKFSPPTVEDVKAYLSELKETRIHPQSFCDYYESKGWMIGKNKMKSWRAAVRTWINKQNETTPKSRYNTL